MAPHRRLILEPFRVPVRCRPFPSILAGACSEGALQRVGIAAATSPAISPDPRRRHPRVRAGKIARTALIDLLSSSLNKHAARRLYLDTEAKILPSNGRHFTHTTHTKGPNA